MNAHYLVSTLHIHFVPTLRVGTHTSAALRRGLRREASNPWVSTRNVGTSLVCLVALLLVGANQNRAAAQETTGLPWRQTFDEQLPGQLPAGWRRWWGEQGDDLFLVSNVRSLSPPNSVLVDRSTGANQRMWGAGVSLPIVPGQWAELTMPFFVEGAASQVEFGLEARAAKGDLRVFAMSVWRREFRVHSYTGRDQEKADSGSLGQLETGIWYRLWLWLPTAEGRQQQLLCILQQRRKQDWEPLGRLVLKAIPPKEPYGALLVNLMPDKRNFNIYLDDLCFQQAAAWPE